MRLEGRGWCPVSLAVACLQLRDNELYVLCGSGAQLTVVFDFRVERYSVTNGAEIGFSFEEVEDAS